jgi:hypothetical protein
MERKHSTLQEESQSETQNKFNFLRQRIGEDNLEEAFTKIYGGIDEYLATILNDIDDGADVNMLYNAEKEFIKSQNEDPDFEGYLQYQGPEDEILATEEAFEKWLLDFPEDRREELREIIGIINNPNRPDASDLPLTTASSGDVDVEGKYDDINVVRDPEDVGYQYDSRAMSSGGDGRDTAVIQAINNLRKLSPYAANLLMDQANRPLFIKKKMIGSIYPPEAKNTNLEIVQQSIARFQYDSSLLNVYFG